MFAKLGNKLNAIVNQSHYPIHEAVKSGNREDVQEALAKNALPNRTTGIRPVDEQDKEYMRTPLHYAADALYNDAHKQGMVKVLLNNRANRSIQDHDGSTAVHLAAARNSVPVVTELLAGIDPNQVAELLRCYDRRGNNALMVAAERGYTPMVMTLLRHMTNDDLRNINQDQNNALMLAAASGHRDVVFALLPRMSPPDLQHSNVAGMTALLIAAERGNKDIVEAVGLRGGRLDARVSATGASALHLAARNGDISTVRWLAENYPGLVSLYDNDRKLPVDWAGPVGVASLLRDYKASPQQQQSAAASMQPYPSQPQRVSDGGGVQNPAGVSFSPLQRLSPGGPPDFRNSAGGGYPNPMYGNLQAGQLGGQGVGQQQYSSLSAPLFGPGAAAPPYNGAGGQLGASGGVALSPGAAQPHGQVPMWQVPRFGQGPPTQASSSSSQSNLMPVAVPRPSGLYDLPAGAGTYV